MKAGRTSLLETGALGSAITASICCIGPLALALLGVGGQPSRRRRPGACRSAPSA